MSRYVRRRSHKKAGQAPGTVVFTGVRRVDATQILAISYENGHFEEWKPDRIDAVQTRETGVTWLNIDGLHDAELLAEAGARFGMHQLAVEDVASTLSRAKIDPYDDALFCTLRMLTYDGERRVAASEQVSLFIREGLVLSFQERPGDVFGGVRNRLRTAAGQIRSRGADYLAYALIDSIIDHYFVVLETLGDEIEELEDAVLEDPSRDTQLRLRSLRSNLTMIRRAVWPLREVLSFLAREDHPLLQDSTRVFVRDAYDHAVQIMDIVESLRDLVSGLQDLVMTTISNRMNDVMKVLTIIGTIFIPLTFIAGIYGMNFENMPELRWPLGYPVALTAMAGLAGLLVLYFRRRDWI